MIKKEVIEKISKYFKLTEFEAEKVYDEIFSIIMNGVKEDNIVDIANFGEFIIKYNNGKTGGTGNGNGFRKTVEFLAASSVEEELNQGGVTYQAPSGVTGTAFSETVPLKDKPIQEETPVKEIPEAHEITEPLPPPSHEETSEASIEEELRKKREEILSKITGPILPGPTGFKIEDSEKKPEPPPVTEEPKIEQPKTEEVKEEIFTTESFNVTAKEEEEEKTTESEEQAEKEVDDISRKSFSDYFSEVTPGTKKIIEEEKPVEEPVKEDFIPKSAVLLHNEITAKEPQKEIIQEEPAIQPQQSAGETERRRDDSYYIWYKDSDSNPTDTQTLSYEYELLYQATKEAEYKSKLKIYVSTFILFFSIVLALLIFSPLIYKMFFSPSETPGTENVQQQDVNGEVTQQKGEPNVLPENTQTQQNETQAVPPADTTKKTEQVTVPADTTKKSPQVPPVNNQITQKNEEKKVQQTPPVTKKETKPEQNKPPEKKEQTNQPEQQKTPQQKATQKQKPQKQESPKQEKNDGLSKNSLGWTDDKLKVIYVQLENGKYTIQESAWDSDAKANKRISAVESLGIPGIKGSMVKADLGAKGIWYRVRFGEFSTLDEARKKAEELRKKEKVKLHAMLFACLFLYT